MHEDDGGDRVCQGEAAVVLPASIMQVPSLAAATQLSPTLTTCNLNVMPGRQTVRQLPAKLSVSDSVQHKPYEDLLASHSLTGQEGLYIRPTCRTSRCQLVLSPQGRVTVQVTAGNDGPVPGPHHLDHTVQLTP